MPPTSPSPARTCALTRLTQRIQADVDEARRLRFRVPSVRRHFAAMPSGQEAWVERVMRDAEEALGEVVVGGSGGPSVDDEDDGGVQERALARCHASLLSVVEKMQRVEEEKGEGEGEGNSRGGGAGGEKALPTYESSRNDERVMPWEYRPEGDVAIKPPLMRRKFIKSRREQASAEVVEGNMGRAIQQPTTNPPSLNHHDFPYLHAFLQTPTNPANPTNPTNEPVELPAEVPASCQLAGPWPQAPGPKQQFLSPQSAYAEFFNHSMNPSTELSVPSLNIPHGSDQDFPSEPRLSAVSKRRSFRKAKFSDNSEYKFDHPDSVLRGFG